MPTDIDKLIAIAKAAKLPDRVTSVQAMRDHFSSMAYVLFIDAFKPDRIVRLLELTDSLRTACDAYEIETGSYQCVFCGAFRDYDDKHKEDCPSGNFDALLSEMTGGNDG